MLLKDTRLLSHAQKRLFDKTKIPPPWLAKLLKQRREQNQRWRTPGSPFNVGQKNVFLPSFTIALLRDSRLPPTKVKFQVPLWFNKLDLRDYLWHAYSIRSLSIRSAIRQHSIKMVTSGSWRDIPGKRTKFRPTSDKFMIVELEDHFVWPEEPSEEELNEEWDYAITKHQQQQQQDNKDRMMGKKGGLGTKHPHRRSKILDIRNEEQREKRPYREIARKLLSGEEKWKGENDLIRRSGPLGLTEYAMR